MFEMEAIRQTLAKLVHDGASPAVQAIAAFCSITGINAVNILWGAFSRIRGAAETDEAVDPTVLYETLNDEDVMRYLVLPFIGSRETSILKSFHSLRPHLTGYLYQIHRKLTGYHPTDAYPTLTEKARAIVHAFPANEPFAIELDRLVTRGYEPILDHVLDRLEYRIQDDEAPAEEIAEIQTQLEVLVRLREWRGEHYRSSPSRWFSDYASVTKLLEGPSTNSYQSLSAKDSPLAGQMTTYLDHRRVFFSTAFAIVTKVLMVTTYYDLGSADPEPLAEHLPMGELRRLHGIETNLNKNTVDGVVARANTLILELLDMTIPQS